MWWKEESENYLFCNTLIASKILGKILPKTLKFRIRLKVGLEWLNK